MDLNKGQHYKHKRVDLQILLITINRFYQNRVDFTNPLGFTVDLTNLVDFTEVLVDFAEILLRLLVHFPK